MAWQTETDQDALQTMAQQPAVDARTKPSGLWERWHIAHDARWTDRYRPNSFSVMLSNRQIPRIVPALKMHGRYLYSEAAVDAFFCALAEHHATARPRSSRGDSQLHGGNRELAPDADPRMKVVVAGPVAERVHVHVAGSAAWERIPTPSVE